MPAAIPRKISRRAIGAAILLVGAAQIPSHAASRKVLVLGIDGCRPDALLKASAPNLKKLADSGFTCWNAKTCLRSYSGPGWSSMITGVWESKHKVLDNTFSSPDYVSYPPFFKRIKDSRPGMYAKIITHWAPIQAQLSAGTANSEAFSSDAEVAAQAVKTLRDENPDILFLQFDEVDLAGHGCCFAPDNSKYIQAIATVDGLIGQVLAAMKGRRTYADEDWLVLSTTDHGGSGNNHGQDIPTHTTIFLIANGPSVRRGVQRDTAHVVDLAVTAMAHILGTSALSPAWGLDGKVFGLNPPAALARPWKPQSILEEAEPKVAGRFLRADGRQVEWTPSLRVPMPKSPPLRPGRGSNPNP